ncbi:MAG: response regulator, partial [Bacteroidales bacterium]|nr:response regulator [Bacteroidales bacterium]
INQATLIVVDDDAEILKYLKSLLIPHYNVHTFFDATEARAAIEEIAPDLIISDVLMPGTDGYSLCRSIKEDSQICHIPVLLLTAKRSVEDQVDGLESGADAYITKPFEPSYLLALIKSQLLNRERIRTLIGNATQISSLEEEKNLSQHDKHFMSELYGIMDQYLADPEVDISLFTDALHISRSKFFYKLKGLTGMSPALFFKTYKLNRAAELLSEDGYSISEIADMTGFSSLSHFSRSFKKQFGKNPSEWNSTKKETV